MEGFFDSDEIISGDIDLAILNSHYDNQRDDGYRFVDGEIRPPIVNIDRYAYAPPPPPTYDEHNILERQLSRNNICTLDKATKNIFIATIRSEQYNIDTKRMEILIPKYLSYWTEENKPPTRRLNFYRQYGRTILESDDEDSDGDYVTLPSEIDINKVPRNIPNMLKASARSFYDLVVLLNIFGKLKRKMELNNIDINDPKLIRLHQKIMERIIDSAINIKIIVPREDPIIDLIRVHDINPPEPNEELKFKDRPSIVDIKNRGTFDSALIDYAINQSISSIDIDELVRYLNENRDTYHHDNNIRFIITKIIQLMEKISNVNMTIYNFYNTTKETNLRDRPKRHTQIDTKIHSLRRLHNLYSHNQKREVTYLPLFNKTKNDEDYENDEKYLKKYLKYKHKYLTLLSS